MDFFTFFVLVCLIVLAVYAYRIEKRRREDAERYTHTAAALTARVHALEQQSQMPWAAHPPATPEAVHAPKAAEPKPATPPAPLVHSGGLTQVPQPMARTAAPSQPPQAVPPKPREVTGIPLTPSVPVKETAHPPVAATAGVAAPPAKTDSPAVTHPVTAETHPPQPAPPGASHAVPSLTQGMVRPPQPPSRPPAAVHVPFSGGSGAPPPAAKERKRPSVSLEESLGTNWFPKVGITLVVLGVAFLMGQFWGNIGPAGRVAILYAAGLGTLAGGIFAERKERYRRVGRALIGGGWAITFVMTYAINHVDALRILPSARADVDLGLMLAVAGVMVWHTLKYNSQTVTGLGFLLGFAAVTLNPDPPYNLIAAAVLVGGMTVIVLRRQWYELEVFGILASYLNHFYWLYTLLNPMPERGPFPQYWNSVALMVLYWAIFRASYLLRKVSGKQQETLSTVAGLLNPLLFLAVMKYQSFHPEWAFRALLTMGLVEFALGQLPVARRRKAPFQILSSVGVTLMVVAVPFKFAGTHSLELLWMAGAEVFLLAGVFLQERLFRQFGGIISLLVAAYVFGWPFIRHVNWAVDGAPYRDTQFGIALAVIAALFYINSHVIGRIWERLFDRDVEQQAMSALSFIASLFSAAAVYALVPAIGVAVVLALLVAALAWTGKRFRIWELGFQAHWIAVVAVIDASINAVHLDAAWHSIPERLLTLGTVAALLYISSNFVRLDQPGVRQVWRQEIPLVLYRWAGTGLIALAIWMQVWFAPVRRDWLIAMLWTAFALVLSAVALLRKRNEFRWQAFVLAMMSFFCALAVNFSFSGQFHGLSYRLISVTLVAGGIYLLARWAPLEEIRPAYSWAGTILLGYLVYVETQERQQLWTAVLWIGLAAVLGLAARFWKDRALLWQTHLLAMAATGWTIAVAFLGKPDYHGTPKQAITVLITAAALYGLTWVTRVAGVVESDRIWQAYSWAGSLLLTWLAWYQLQPINVSLAWGLFALLLFELGYNTSSSYLRAQAYVALACSFAHLFYSNFNTRLAAGTFDFRIFLIALLVPIYFWVYWRLHERTGGSGTEKQLRIEYLLACLGTATVAALARFELSPEAVVIGYAAIVLALLAAAWWSELHVFLYQALIMLGVTGFRLVMHNFRNLRDSFISTLSPSLWAIGILALGIPIAFRLRDKQAEGTQQNWITFLVRRPEQPLFFAAVVLMAALLAIQLPDMITLAWGIEGVVVFLLALIARERSFRLTGFTLVVICVGKIALWDAWRMNDPRARYLTFIGVGVVILVVSYLYARYKEALREYL